MLGVAQELGTEGHVEKQEDEVTPAVLKVVHSVLLPYYIRKGDLDKLVELLNEGACKSRHHRRQPAAET